MDTISNSVNSVQQRTPTKRSKSKKNNNNNKPLKVVYISNPMNFKTSVSEFRALVQELTGQDAELPPDPSRFHQDSGGDDDGSGRGGGGGGGGDQNMDSDNCLMKIGQDIENDHTLVVPPPIVDPNNNCQGQLGGGSASRESFEPFDEVFTPQMIENISALLPASVFYESPQADQVLMQCNYIHQ